jgi:hypothetical protein
MQSTATGERTSARQAAKHGDTTGTGRPARNKRKKAPTETPTPPPIRRKKKAKQKIVLTTDSDTDSVESVTPPAVRKKKPTSILRSPSSQSSISVDASTPPTRPPGRPKEPQRKIVDPANTMEWELYDTPVALHVWVAPARWKKAPFGKHPKFKIDTTSSLDIEELYTQLQESCDTENWDMTSDHTGFKLYYRDQLNAEKITGGQPLDCLEDYRTSLNKFA